MATGPATRASRASLAGDEERTGRRRDRERRDLPFTGLALAALALAGLLMTTAGFAVRRRAGSSEK